MAKRETVDPTTNDHGYDEHPAWGMIGAYRVQVSPPGSTLFDSDIRHAHTVIVRLRKAERKRRLNHDHIVEGREFVEIEMSEAQWASFVSSMNSSGVPCTIRRREDDVFVPEMPFEPRMKESMAEVRGAADKAAETVRAAFAVYAEKKNARNLRSLQAAIDNMPANVEFAAKSMTEHAENVVQRARADIEAMVTAKAAQLGLDPGDVLDGPALLGGGDDADS